MQVHKSQFNIIFECNMQAQIGGGLGDLVPPNFGQVPPVKNLVISTNFYILWY